MANLSKGLWNNSHLTLHTKQKVFQQNIHDICQTGKPPGKLLSQLATTYLWHHAERKSFEQCCAGASRLLEYVSFPLSTSSSMAGSRTSNVRRSYTKWHHVRSTSNGKLHYVSTTYTKGTWNWQTSTSASCSQIIATGTMLVKEESWRAKESKTRCWRSEDHEESNLRP